MEQNENNKIETAREDNAATTQASHEDNAATQTSHEEMQKKLKKQRIRQIIASLIGVAILAFGLWKIVCLFLDYNANETSNDAQVEQYISPVNLRASGYIAKVCFKEHEEVLAFSHMPGYFSRSLSRMVTFAFPQSMVAGRKARSCLAVSSRVS